MNINVEKTAYILHLVGIMVNEGLGKLHLISEEKWERSNYNHIMRMKDWFEFATGKDFFEELKKR